MTDQVFCAIRTRSVRSHSARFQTPCPNVPARSPLARSISARRLSNMMDAPDPQIGDKFNSTASERPNREWARCSFVDVLREAAVLGMKNFVTSGNDGFVAASAALRSGGGLGLVASTALGRAATRAATPVPIGV